MKMRLRSAEIFICLAALMLIAAYAVGAKTTPVQEVKPGLYAISWPEGAGNVAFLVTSKGVIAVDTGESIERGKEIVARIREKTAKPIKYLILTHYHGDHTRGLSAFPKTAVVIGQQNLGANMKADIASDLEAFPKRIEELRQQIVTLAKDSEERKQAEQRLKAQEKAYRELKREEPTFPALEFDSALTIHLGEDTVAVHYPGGTHTNCSSVVHFIRQKAVHMGDTLFAGSHPYIDADTGANTKNWITFLNSVQKWDADAFIPGHGPISGKEALANQVRYLEDLRREVAAAQQKGLSLEEAQKAIALPAYKDFKLPFLLPHGIAAVYKELAQKNNK